jgi:CRP-like cAMP-binding protein
VVFVFVAVVALVTQADYKRVVRFNVDNETQLLDTVREILTPPKVTKQSPHQTTVNEPPRPDLSPQQVRIIMRFIGRFKCFRVLPYQFCMEMVSKLQFLTVKGDEVFAVSSDDSPSMIMVLDGKLCVHVCESHESQRLRFACRELDHAGGRPHPTSKKPVSLEATEYLPGCEAGSNVESSIGANSLHICSLAAGDSFGELAISSTETAKQGASIYQPFTASGQMAATVVRVSRHHYMAALQRYIETADFNLATVSSILSRSLPQDRTDEQVQYMKTFLLLRSSARLFFGQLPGQVLESVLLHAGIDSKVVDEEIGEFIQKEGSTVESMKIVLNGYVGVFKSTANVANPLSTDTGVNGTPIPPKRAVLRRYQSRLIRANTHILDTDGGMHSGRLASAQRTALALPKVVIPELHESDREDAHAIDPISVLPSGAAFGHLQILTGQLKSLYSYAAFASGSGVLDDTRSGAVTDASQRIHMLSIPARFVHLYLASLDDQILYNPLRAIKRLQHEGLSLGADEAVPVSTIRRLQLSRLLTRNMAFAGIPKRAASSMIEDMEVVRAEPSRVIYEVGTPIQRALFVVLRGSVRVFSYVSKAKTGRDRRGSLLPGSDEKKTKLPRRISQNASGSRQEEAAACSEWPVPFSKPANDSIFLSDYSRTTELVCGDVFGRHEAHSFAKPRTQRLSTGPSGSTRQASPQTVYVDNVVSMTDCLLAVVPRRDHQCELSCDERRLLMRVIDDGGDSKWRGRTDRIDEDDNMAPAGTFDSLAVSFHVLDSMDLTNQISTHDRVHLANRLRYMKLAPGETGLFV